MITEVFGDLLAADAVPWSEIVDRPRDHDHDALVMSADRPQPISSVLWSRLPERRLALTRLRGALTVHGDHW